MNYPKRFTPDGECLPLAVDFFSFFLQKKIYPIDAIRSIQNFKTIIEFLNRNGFDFLLYMPVYQLLSPKRLLIYLRYRSRFCIKAEFYSKKSLLKKQVTTHVTLYFLSATNIYKINEVWNHYVVGYLDDGVFRVQDDLYAVLAEQYPGLKCIHEENDLDDFKAVKFLIWNAQRLTD